jgi:hypothetical protein
VSVAFSKAALMRLSLISSFPSYSAGDPPATWRSVLCISSFIWE